MKTRRFALIPTQPLVAGNGLRLAFSINDEPAQIVVIKKDTDVSSPNWANNILNAATIGKSKINLKKRHSRFENFRG